MRLESNSLFMKIFFLVALAVITSNLVWFLLLHILSTEPRAKTIAQIAVSAVNVVKTSLLAAAPEKREFLLKEFSKNEGIFVHTGDSVSENQHFIIANHHHGNTHFYDGDGDALLRFIQREVQQKLGSDTRVAIGINGNEGLWVSFKFNKDDKKEYWLELSRYVQKQSVPPLLLWGTLTTIIVIILSYKLARHISLPIINLSEIAVAFGRRNTLGNTQGSEYKYSNFEDTLEFLKKQETELENSSKEIRTLTSSFHEMIKNLNDTEKEREVVLAGISHDLRTPLTRLRLEVEMSFCDDTDCQQEMIDDIEQIEDIIRQFMEFAKTNYIETPCLYNPAKVFEEIMQNEVLHNRELKTKLQQNFVDMKLHKNALERAILNLINNAWKYGKPPIELRAFTKKDPETKEPKFLVIEVVDYGDGVKLEQMENLTHPFARGEAARTNVTGTGLGLAIVERIVKYHNGKLEFESGQQEKFKGQFGLLVRLTLPITN